MVLVTENVGLARGEMGVWQAGAGRVAGGVRKAEDDENLRRPVGVRSSGSCDWWRLVAHLHAHADACN
jgi:hypothetical protein